jgi:hypothetical protein
MTSIFIRILVICVIAFWFGGTMIWRGTTGQVRRSNFTGEAIIPPWLYIATGVAAIALTVGYIVVTYLLAKA